VILGEWEQGGRVVTLEAPGVEDAEVAYTVLVEALARAVVDGELQTPKDNNE